MSFQHLKKIANVSELAPLQCKEFEVKECSGRVYNGFLVNSAGKISAYINSCPHLQLELNWQPNEFLNFDCSHIICATHGALFRINDGYCVQGPCIGQHLQELQIKICADEIFLCQ